MYLWRFITLKTQIQNEAQVFAKMDVMVLFDGLDKRIQPKIQKKLEIPDMKNELIMLKWNHDQTQIMNSKSFYQHALKLEPISNFLSP